jgi:hypothetical protein
VCAVTRSDGGRGGGKRAREAKCQRRKSEGAGWCRRKRRKPTRSVADRSDRDVRTRFDRGPPG